MAIEIRMPRLGWTMEEGAFGEWLKADGDTIQPGDLLYTVESDKATQEVEALDAGILRIDPAGPRSGDMVTVGTLLAYLIKEGEGVAFAQLTQPSDDETSAVRSTAAPSSVNSARSPATNIQASGVATPTISPRARRVATELDIDWQTLTGSGRTGRIVERDIRAAAATQQTASSSAIRATPVAARIAQETGIDLAALAAENPGQRIGRAAVEAAIAAQQTVAEETTAPAPSAARHIPITRVRQLIAQRMNDGAHTTAPVTLTTEVDATALVDLRSQLKAAFGPRGEAVPSYNDLLIKLTAVALMDHPLLRAVWHEDELTIEPGIHIGLAVDTAEGLLVPVVHEVQAKSLRQVTAATQQLIMQARQRKLSPNTLRGGNFTLTNLGQYNIDAFTPIINLPQCAILGVGRIAQKPAVYNGAVIPRHMVTLSLTFDHRVVDGSPAARFLDTIRGYIETPLLWLVG